jgi:hypothetical protein
MKPRGFPERIAKARGTRILVLGALLLLLATITRPGPRPPPQGPGEALLTIAPVALDAAAPGRRRVGALLFLGGWALASGDDRFGGISGIHVEGGRIVAISDVGMVMRFAVPGAGATEPVRFDPLVAGPGPRTRKSNRDTEALVVSGRTLWAAFERHNMIWRYDLASLAAQSSARPAPMRHWGGNRGAEALVRLAGGRFLVLSEGRDDGSAASAAVLFAGDPSVPGTPAAALSYRRPAGFRATDAALLPDGRILILNRRFALLEGWSARLVAAQLGADGTIAGREVAALAAPLVTENMEALAVSREGGRTIVWIASDDNFSPLQRTLLLKFEWLE